MLKGKTKEELLEIVNSGSSDGFKTHALEAFKHLLFDEDIAEILLKYSYDSSSLLREGALYGLEHFVNEFYKNDIIFNRIVSMSNSDKSDGIRVLAQEILEDCLPKINCFPGEDNVASN